MAKITRSETRRVLITGATGGIGTALLELFLTQTRHRIIAHYHRQRPLAPSSREKGRVLWVQADLSSERQVQALAQRASRVWGGVDILINNAATLTDQKDLFHVTSKELRRTLEVNLVAPFTLSQLMLPAMLYQGWGRIINLSSIGFKFGGSLSAPHYSVSKAALEALTQNLAKVAACDNVLVNTVRVGATWTPMQKKRMKYSAKRARMIPLRRMAEPQEIAQAIFFLTTEQASYISGATLDVSGGE